MNDIFQLSEALKAAKSENKKKLAGILATAVIGGVFVAAVTGAVNNTEKSKEMNTAEYSISEQAISSIDNISQYYAVASVASKAAASANDGDCSVIVRADGKTIIVDAKGTVSNAIEIAGLTIDEDDLVNADVNAKLYDGAEIVINRVEYKTRKKKYRTKFDTVTYDDENLPEGTTAVVTEGQKGKLIVEYTDTIVDGEVVSTEETARKVISEPVDEVIAVGTLSMTPVVAEDVPAIVEKPSETDEFESAPVDEDLDYNENDANEEVVLSIGGETTFAENASQISQLDVPDDIVLDEDGVPLVYTSALHGKSCAYTASEGALMSTGKAVDQGYVAVNPKIIPYGSKLWIVADDGEVYGYAIAADTGGSVGRNDILVDLFMWSYDDCIQWGAKNVTIYVIE